MVEPQASHFWQAALRSGLIDAPSLQAHWDAIPPEKRTAASIDRRLARRVVEAGKLTTWQAQQLLSGRSTSFRINRYLLLDFLGHGGMGQVYLARDTCLDRDVALKLLSFRRKGNPTAVARFRREVRIGAQLQHENLVRVYDAGELGGQDYLIMEYIDGQSVGQLLTEYGPLPAPTAARLARQVALGLEHAQKKGLIHRDVNPWNILVTSDGIAKLTDMGLAIELGDSEIVTRDGTTVGTFDYLSPEQAQHSREIDTRSDIYSLGCTLFHMLTGQIPFPVPSLPEKLYSHMLAEPVSPSSIVPGVPEGLSAVVLQMMRKMPEERHPTPLAVARALEPFIEGEPASSADLAPAPWDLPRAAVMRLASAWNGPGGRGAVNGRVGDTYSHTSPAQVLTPPSREDLPLSRPEIDPSRTSRSGSNAPGPGSSGFGTPHSATAGAMDIPPHRTFGSHEAGPGGPASSWTWAFEGRPWGRRAVIISLAAAALVLLLGTVAVTLGRRDWQLGGPADLKPAKAQNPGPGREPPKPPRGITIIERGRKETEVSDLKEALGRAGGGDLQILLYGQDSMHWEASEALVVPDGTVTIRAAEGARPDLIVELTGSAPFLRVRPRAILKLEGVRIRAEYSGHGAKPPPLIEADGWLELRNCAFRTLSQAPGTQAISTEGERLSVSGCWFQGFEQCLNLGAFAGMEAQIDQCMFIRDPLGDPLSSWAVRVRQEPSHASGKPRRLAIRRCTIWDACFLRVEDFTAEGPLCVAVEENAVVAALLMAWKSEMGLDDGALKWSGRTNLFNAEEAAWGLGSDGLSATLEGPIDRDEWAELMGEEGNRAQTIPFPDPPSTALESLRPVNFPSQVQWGVAIGADPNRVGPPTGPIGDR